MAGEGASLSTARQPPDLRELRRAAAELIRRAVLTLAVTADPDRRWQGGPRCAMPEPLREAVESYGYQAPRAARFQPTPRDFDRYLQVLGWLSWLRRQPDGERETRLLLARAFGTPRWRLGQRFGKSDETLRLWENAAVAKIVLEFCEEIERLSR
jgi:hypothetical protein